MRLNYKRTILVGLSFFSICAFWQLYDSIIPLILRDTFRLNDTISGIIMSLDNILALVLLPVFGAWSDKKGRRIPFILVGTGCAVLFMIAIPLADRMGSLWVFFTALCLLLIAMGIYRSPAVALMPDITPKPFRSKANAVINLMGAFGGVFTLGAIALLVKTPEYGTPDYFGVFSCVAGLMLVAVVILFLTIDEKKYALPEEIPSAASLQKDRAEALPPEVRKSLVLILLSVSFWYMGYNAVTTAFTKYATAVWGQNVAQASSCLMIATVGAVISYIPIGMLASRIGRKKTILIGVVGLAGCFAISAVAAQTFHTALYAVFLLVGFSWAAINVNSYPMVVEISKLDNVGKYTGYYYAFSMAAQVITPILSGMLLDHVGYHTLFPYAACMVAVSFFTMLFTRHGDNRPAKKASKLEHFDFAD